MSTRHTARARHLRRAAAAGVSREVALRQWGAMRVRPVWRIAVLPAGTVPTIANLAAAGRLTRGIRAITASFGALGIAAERAAASTREVVRAYPTDRDRLLGAPRDDLRRS